jgi:hypothetical protein
MIRQHAWPLLALRVCRQADALGSQRPSTARGPHSGVPSAYPQTRLYNCGHRRSHARTSETTTHARPLMNIQQPCARRGSSLEVGHARRGRREDSIKPQLMLGRPVSVPIAQRARLVDPVISGPPPCYDWRHTVPRRACPIGVSRQLLNFKCSRSTLFQKVSAPLGSPR